MSAAAANRQTCSQTMLCLVHSESALDGLNFALRIAARRGAVLKVLCINREDHRRSELVNIHDSKVSALATAALERLVVLGVEGAEVIDAQGPSLYRIVIESLINTQAGTLLISEPIAAEDGSEPALIANLARSAYADVLWIHPAATTEPVERPIFVMPRQGSKAGILFALHSLGGEDTAISVVSATMPSEAAVKDLSKSLERLPAPFAARIQIERNPLDSDDFAERMEAHHVLMFEANGLKQLERQQAAFRKLQSQRDDLQPAACFFRSTEHREATWLERTADWVRLHLPHLERDERKTLIERLESDGHLSVDFMVMLVISAGIAALGLIQNSTAVVIGAMLVAPLMIPILAIGMALVQANLDLFREALKATVAGVVAAYLAAALIGLTSPYDDMSSEIAARGGANLFDLGIALLSGIAAAYSLARSRMAGALVGVAVAVALVPPLAASAIASVKGEWTVAMGAGVLFSTNLLAIILGAAMVFRVFGLHVTLGGSRAPRWVRHALASLAAALALVSLLLAHNQAQQMGEGVQRPYYRPLPQVLRNELRARIEAETGVEIILMAESTLEHGFGTEVILLADGPVSPSLRGDLEQAIRRMQGENKTVRVLIVQGQADSLESTP
ncbi:MAG: DUF389 domain-containing protein [Pseudomonadota bacterium]